MNPKASRYLIFAAAVLLVSFLSGFAYFSGSKLHKELPAGNERELKVTLQAGFGDVSLSRGSAARILDADFNTEKNGDVDDFIDYSVRDRVGYLDINTNADVKTRQSGRRGVHFEGFTSNTWDVRLTDALPISFDVGLGMGKGNFDFTGLKVKDLKFSAGASSVDLRFDRPNPTTIEDLTIESGLSKFHGTGLCNANFNHLKFEGGVGDYVLDFSGPLNKEVDVDIEVGLGSLVVKLPENIGARVIYEKSWIAHIALDADFREQQENNYFSSNYRNAAGKMNIRIEAGLGSVTVVRE